MAHASSLDNRNRDAGGMEGSHHGLFIAAGGLAHDLYPGVRTEKFEESTMTFGVIGQEVRVAWQVKLQGGLGNVQASVEDSRVVLTHTCGNTSRVRAERTRSSNGSSLDQRAGVERAPRRITHRAYARRKRPHVRHRLAACRRPGDPSLVPASSRTKWTIS